MGLVIANGRILDPANLIDKTTDLYIEAGKIAGLGQLPMGFTIKAGSEH